MNIASIIVVAVLIWCFFFFVSLPFGVEREQQNSGSFGGVKKPNLWIKVGFASVMSTIATSGFYWTESNDIFARLFE